MQHNVDEDMPLVSGVEDQSCLNTRYLDAETLQDRPKDRSTHKPTPRAVPSNSSRKLENKIKLSETSRPDLHRL